MSLTAKAKIDGMKRFKIVAVDKTMRDVSMILNESVFDDDEPIL